MSAGASFARIRACRREDKHDLSTLPHVQYAYLLGMYLGDGCLSASHRGVWRLRVALDARYPGIVEECAQAMEAVVPGKRAHRYRRTPGRCVEVSMWWKHWPCLFPQHGSGRKHLRRIVLADWQQEIIHGSHEAFLRGLLHSDGCRFVAIDKSGGGHRPYTRYAFSNLSEDIKGLFCASCDALGITWTRASYKDIAIARREAVHLLDEFVGPKY